MPLTNLKFFLYLFSVLFLFIAKPSFATILSEKIQQTEIELSQVKSSLNQPLDNIETIKKQLKMMVDIDQRVRNIWVTDLNNPEISKLVTKVDKLNTTHLKKILALYDWITISKFGPEADSNAWLLVQHADLDPDFQARCAFLLEQLLPMGETSKKNFAYLYDRVALKFLNIGLKQRYGTQAKLVNGKFELFPYEGTLEELNKRRQEVGLPSAEEYLTLLQEMYPNA